MLNASIDFAAGTITLPLADFARITRTDKLVFELPVPEPVMLPRVTLFHVSAYTQVFVRPFGSTRGFWVCSCNDFRYRRQSPEGRPPQENSHCKHIIAAMYRERPAAQLPGEPARDARLEIHNLH